MEYAYNQLATSKDEILGNFMEKYFFVNKDLSQKSLEMLMKIFDKTLTDFFNKDYKNLQRDYETLSYLGIKSKIPYVVLMHELEYIKNRIITLMFENDSAEVGVQICKMSNDFESIIAKKYMLDYLDKLIEKNQVKINNLKEMTEKDIVRFYEDHMEWLNSLVEAIKFLDAGKLPDTNPKCSYAKWLCEEASGVIKNKEKYRLLVEQHEALHHVANKIRAFIEEKNIDYHILMTYVEKAEMISLDMGTELAMIDNSVMISKSSKDKLTGALNRNLMENIFTNQYELAVATDKPFVMAMCDLDDFKKINDTYGHLAGDEMLRGFAQLALGSLRASDIMIRYGGEEFLFIIPAVGGEKGADIFDKIRQKFEEYCCDFDGNSIKTTVSIGVTEVKPQESMAIADIKMADFIRIADERMYLAKRSGKNRVR